MLDAEIGGDHCYRVALGFVDGRHHPDIGQFPVAVMQDGAPRLRPVDETARKIIVEEGHPIQFPPLTTGGDRPDNRLSIDALLPEPKVLGCHIAAALGENLGLNVRGPLLEIRRHGVEQRDAADPDDEPDHKARLQKRPSGHAGRPRHYQFQLAAEGYIASTMMAYEDGVLEILLRELGDVPGDAPLEEVRILDSIDIHLQQKEVAYG